MWIEGHPALHIIDRGTRYSVAKILENESAEHFWDIIINFWVMVFTGYPSVIFHDQVLQFTAEYFQTSGSQIGVISTATPTQSHNSLGLCERYHSIIRRVYNKLKDDFPTLSKEERLSIFVHAVNKKGRS